VNHPSRLKLTIVQKNKLKAFMRNTNNKKEYRRLLAMLQKAEGRTFEDIANEHGVSSRSVQRWVVAYIQSGIDGVKMKKPGGLKSGITDEDKEIIL
jgi:transposase